MEKNKFTQEETIKAINSNISSYKSEYGDNIALNKAADKNIYAANNIKDLEVDKSGKGFMYFMTCCMSCMGVNVCVSTYDLTHSLSMALIEMI